MAVREMGPNSNRVPCWGEASIGAESANRNPSVCRRMRFRFVEVSGGICSKTGRKSNAQLKLGREAEAIIGDTPKSE